MQSHISYSRPRASSIRDQAAEHPILILAHLAETLSREGHIEVVPVRGDQRLTINHHNHGPTVVS